MRFILASRTLLASAWKIAAIGLLGTFGLPAQPSAGEAIYLQRCARCHDAGNPRAPSRDELKHLSASRIQRALDFGAMSNIGFTMPQADHAIVAAFLGLPDASAGLSPKAYCNERSVKLPANPSPAWNGWSPAATNTRFQPANAAGLTLDQVKHLKLKWSYGFDGDIVAFAQPTVLGNYLFVGSAGGVVQALDRESGCLYWTFQATGPVRASAVVAPVGGKFVVLVGDQVGWFYSLDAETGKLLWKKKIEEHQGARLTGSPVAYQGTVFVPVSSWEETLSDGKDYPCCSSRGLVAALRVRDGSEIWRTYTVPEKPKLLGGNRWGPSGASVWSAPTLDPKRGVLYVTTGDNFSEPATSMSDAVVAMDLANGKIVWSKQTVSGDIFSSQCWAFQTNNCAGPDFDFGSSALLAKMGKARDILLAGQKSGIVYGLDPDRKGEILWQTRVGKGGLTGGIQWGMAGDGEKVYAAVSDLGRGGANPDPLDPLPMPVDPKQGGGLTALNIVDGKKVWYAPPSVCGPKRGCSPAQSAAISVIPGVVFSGALDGHLRGFSTENGEVLWDFDTVREYQTVNGVRASGGSMNGPGPIVVGGMLFVNSGYGRSGAMAGNVLLAFAPSE
jgi:polyvinyl alcohol dehydrogenase (cytochrome)